MFHVDIDGLILCPLWESTEEIIPLQTLAVSGATKNIGFGLIRLDNVLKEYGQF